MDLLAHPFARQISLALVICLHLIGDLAAIPIVYRLKLGEESGATLAALSGVLLGQLSLLAGYLAWGSDGKLVRWSASSLLVLLAWYAVTAGAVSTGDSFEVGSIEQLLAMVTALPFLFMALLGWAIRGICGSRLEVIPDDRLPQRWPMLPAPLVVIGSAAILAAIAWSSVGREIWAGKWSISSGDWLVISLWMWLWSALCVLVAIPAAWVCLGKAPPASRLLGVGSYVALLVAAEWAIFYAVTDEARLSLLIVVLNLGILGEVVPCSLLFRLCGYRLHLYGRRAAWVPTDARSA